MSGVPGPRGDTPAAVLLPLYRGERGEPRLILIERTDHGRHGGQIALPGGKYEPGDDGMRGTAVRETCEELGIAEDDLDVLAELPATATRSTRYLVSPFVARLRRVPATWRPQEREVASVLDVAVADLAEPAARDEEEMSFPRWNYRERVPVIRVAGHTIWGLTLRILEPVLPRVLAGEFEL